MLVADNSDIKLIYSGIENYRAATLLMNKGTPSENSGLLDKI
jgi:hypothetical protein